MAIALAFSGGLDTSFCVPYLKETYQDSVFTVTVDTGGLEQDAHRELEEKALRLGASRHITVDGREALYRDHLQYLIMGNVLRGGVYPLCVGSERVVQARMLVEIAKAQGANAIAHGCTGAGNDQVRFDVVIRMLADEMNIIAPIRENGFTRRETTEFLEARGYSVPPASTSYSINTGIWGTTIGGAETLTTTDPLPDEAYPETVSPLDAPEEPETIELWFENGLPVALSGEPLGGVEMILRLSAIGARHGVGRGMHMGDTILGLKGRVAFEAPGPLILLAAHRELEKIVLSKWQRFQKDQLSEMYGMLLHEGQHYDPVMRDIEAYFKSSQGAVSGSVRVQLYKGNIEILGCDSPSTMFNTDIACYGEHASLWDGRDAQGFCRIAGLQAYLAYKSRSEAGD